MYLRGLNCGGDAIVVNQNGLPVRSPTRLTCDNTCESLLKGPAEDCAELDCVEAVHVLMPQSTFRHAWTGQVATDVAMPAGCYDTDDTPPQSCERYTPAAWGSCEFTFEIAFGREACVGQWPCEAEGPSTCSVFEGASVDDTQLIAVAFEYGVETDTGISFEMLAD
ncbi:MAG: hypothetical protein AAGA56_09020 [Myxococcota bacterium]